MFQPWVESVKFIKVRFEWFCCSRVLHWCHVGVPLVFWDVFCDCSGVFRCSAGEYADIWKAVTALCAKSMRPFHYIMQCPHCVMRFLVWLCVLFMGLYFYIIWFCALTIRLYLKKIRFCTLVILLSFGYELFLFGYGLFSFSYGFFKYALFIWLCAHLI